MLEGGEELGEVGGGGGAAVDGGSGDSVGDFDKEAAVEWFGDEVRGAEFELFVGVEEFD